MITNIMFILEIIGALIGFTMIGILIQFIIVEICKKYYKRTDYDSTLFIVGILLWPWILLIGPMILVILISKRYISKVTGVKITP